MPSGAIVPLSVSGEPRKAIAARLAALERRVAAQDERIAQLVAELERRLAARRPNTAALLSAIAGSIIGSSAFSASDIVTLATHDRHVAAVVAGYTVRGLGLAFRRIARRPVEGYALLPVKRTAEGRMWIIEVL